MPPLPIAITSLTIPSDATMPKPRFPRDTLLVTSAPFPALIPSAPLPSAIAPLT
jgi:hypothetical protein